MITSIKKKKEKRIEIDLTGPDGNVFNLMSIATDLAKTFNKRRENEYFNVSEIQADMMSSDYNHAVNVVEKHFGEYVIMYR